MGKAVGAASGSREGAGTVVRFEALDGYLLGGALFDPPVGAPATDAAALVCGGGGVPAFRYRRLARYLAEHGVSTLTFDYRGVGASRPPSLRGFTANAEDWAEHDIGGAIRWLEDAYPGRRLAGIAHSIGAFLVGGAAEANRLSSLAFIAAHTGYVGDYARAYRLPMALLWHGVMPALTRLYGYFPGRALALGDDIPAGVARQWAARRHPEFRPELTDANPERARRMLARHRTLALPALSIAIADDAFATPRATARLLAIFPGLTVQTLEISPKGAGVPKIGHFGVCRAGIGEPIWGAVAANILSSRQAPQAAQAE